MPFHLHLWIPRTPQVTGVSLYIFKSKAPIIVISNFKFPASYLNLFLGFVFNVYDVFYEFTIFVFFDIGNHTHFIHFIGALYGSCDTVALIKDMPLSISTKTHHTITTNRYVKLSVVTESKI